jgi:hypothetical protein
LSRCISDNTKYPVIGQYGGIHQKIKFQVIPQPGAVGASQAANLLY